MSDAALRELVRAAERGRDPAAVMKALRALHKVGRSDEACALEARLGGGESFLDELAPPSVTALELVPPGAPHEVQALSHVAWSPDGRTLFAADDRRALLARDEASGAWREVAPLDACVKALAIDPEGDRALLCVSDTAAERRGADDLCVVELGKGTIGPRLKLGLNVVGQVSSRAGRDLLLVSGRTTAMRRVGQWVAGFRRDGTALWRETAPLVALHAEGFVTVKRGKLGFHGYDAPAAPFTVKTPCRPADTDRLSAARGRAVVIAESISLVASSGVELASAALPLTTERAFAPWTEVAASPSGRHVAAVSKRRELTLVDVASGHTVTHALDAQPRRPVWSPSGRTLAVPLDSGRIAFLRADPAPADALEPAPTEERWVALALMGHFGPTATWSARRVGRTVELRWGQRGGRPTTRRIEGDDEASARTELERRVRAKRKEGYVDASAAGA